MNKKTHLGKIKQSSVTSIIQLNNISTLKKMLESSICNYISVVMTAKLVIA